MFSKKYFCKRNTFKIARPVLVALSVNGLTLMLLVANLATIKWGKKYEKWLKPWQMGTHMRVLSERFTMNTNKTGFRSFFHKSLHPCALDESHLSIKRVKSYLWKLVWIDNTFDFGNDLTLYLKEGCWKCWYYALPLKCWTPKIFMTPLFEHPHSKSWHFKVLVASFGSDVT